MEIKRFNSSASDLVSRWDSIGTIKRPERNTEMLIQSTESLDAVLYTVNEKVTKELQLGKTPSSKCIKWLCKAAEIQTQVNEIMLKSKGQNSNLLRHSRMYLRGIQSIINKIQDLIEKSPYWSGSMAYLALGKSETITSPTIPGEAYGQIQEMQQDICLPTPATPSRDALTKTSEAQTRNAASQNEGGQKVNICSTSINKSREPTINQAEGKIPVQNEGGEALLEVDSGGISVVETGNVACHNEGGGQALLEAGISAVVSSKQILHKILKCMNEGTSSSIAIHGIGGIGKTTTLKALVNHVKSMFDVIIWVTVSRDWSTRKIQNEVLRQLGLSLPDSETDSKVAGHLLQFLSSRKFLFILDDVWKRVDLTALGIPSLSPVKGCRIILASRILDVCKEMAGKRVFEMEPLSRKEAWALFHKQVGALVESQGIRHHAQNIVRECGGLPLLIIATGRAMRGVNAGLEWKRALEKLELPRKLGKNGNEAVMQRLKFSFDSLKSSEIKSCFLYCALFSEDNEVKISELVRFCIAEGLISPNWGDKRGHDMVDFLVDASLLQSIQGGLAIKMHDLMRELALMITLSGEERTYSKVIDPSVPGISSFCRPPENPENPTLKKESPESNGLSIPEGYHFLLRAGAGLKEPPPEDKWEHAKLIALMDNELSRLPETPSCPNLQKLFLQRNRNLRMIPASFFECMPTLEVLNLSDTRIKFLPQLISKLKALKVLTLRNCERLVILPSEVGSLGGLEVLDLHGTEVNRLPDEIGALSCLRHLEVSFYGSISPDEYALLPPDLVSDGILSKLICLETLSIDVYPGDQRWTKSVESIITDICQLNNLTALSFYFPEVDLLKYFLRTCPTWKDNLLHKFKFVVGYDVKRFVSRVPNYVVVDYDQQGQCLRFVNGEKVDDVVVEVLARTVAFYLDHHLSINSLSEFGVRNISGLKLCIVSECPQIHSIIDGEDLNEPTQTVFSSLEYLSIHYLWNLKCIWKGTIPHTSFSKLRILMVHACPELIFVLTTSMLSCVSNLEELVVEDCSAVEAIILQGETKSSETNLAPSLRRLTLSTLPKLVNIWEGGWPSVEYINLFNCPNWKTISMNSQVQVRYEED